MKTIGLVCEFNPFHHGHAGLLSAIRREFGEDATVVAVMSGSFVQRGEPAMFDKYARAQAALFGGCDLVLELPFPASAGSAERFASAAISVLDDVGDVDILAFGSECGDTSALSALAVELEAPCYRTAWESFPQDNAVGGAKKTEVVYESVYGKTERSSLFSSPNDVLGIAYIRALLRRRSSIKPVAFPRQGAAHGETALPKDAPISSATEARRLLAKGEDLQKTVLDRLPFYASKIFRKEISEGKIVADIKKWQDTLLLSCRMASADCLAVADGLGGGLSARISRAAVKARDGEEFFNLIRTKKYTDAFLRRALLAAFLGITKEELNAKPLYTQILGMSERGRGFLAHVRKTSKISLLTKPADYRALSVAARAAAERSNRADAVYASLFSSPVAPADFLRRRPCQIASNDFPPSALDKP